MMIPENIDEKTLGDLIADVICVIFSIVVLNICYRNIAGGIFKIFLKLCE